MNKIIEWVKKYYIYIISFIIPFFIFLIFIYVKDIAPFGNNTLLKYDLLFQYVPMLDNIFNNAVSEGNFLYSFNYGIGQPIFKVFFNYCSSPFNLFLLFFNKSNIMSGITFLIAFKCSLISLSMSIFLSKKFDKKNLLVVALSLLYAFSGYFQAYYFNIMWIDGMIFLPLIVLGIENICNGKSNKLYIVSLFLMIWSNYYIAYMICLFCVVYFFMFLFYKTKIRKDFKKEDVNLFKKKIFVFVGSSILVGLFSAFFLIPYLYGISSIDSINIQRYFPANENYIYKVNFINFILAHLDSVEPSILLDKGFYSPNIYCGVFSVFLFVSFLFNSRLTINTKFTYLIILLFVVLGFFFSPMDHIFNAFHIPNDIPYRYSFLYTFVFIVMSSYALFNYDYRSKNNYIIFFFLLFSLISFLFIDFDIITREALILNIFILVLYFGVITFIRFEILFYILFFVFVIVETFFNTYNYYPINSTKLDTHYYVDSCVSDSFRCANSFENFANSSLIYDTFGVSSFSSVEYGYVVEFMSNFGLKNNNVNSYNYNKVSEFFDILMSINKKSNLMFPVSNDLKNFSFVDRSNKNFSVNNLNNIAKHAFGVDDLIYNYEKDYEIEILFEDNDFIIEKYIVNTPLVFDLYNVDFILYNEYMFALNTNFKNYDFLSYNRAFNYNGVWVNKVNLNDIFIIGRYKNDNSSISVFNEDDNKLKNILDYIGKSNTKIIENKEYYIKVSSYVYDEQIMYTSIPYDEGWSVYVDGEKVDTYKIMDSLLGFDVEKGEHIIELKYQIPLFVECFILSFSSFVVYILFNFILKRKVS